MLDSVSVDSTCRKEKHGIAQDENMRVYATVNYIAHGSLHLRECENDSSRVMDTSGLVCLQVLQTRSRCRTSKTRLRRHDARVE